VSLDYREKIEIEQLRSIEQQSQALTIRAQPASSFEAFLRQRVSQSKLQPEFESALDQAQHWFRTLLLGSCLLSGLAGMLAVVQAVSGAGTLNVFWVLMVLLGFNLLSFVLWLLFTFVLRTPASSPLVSIFMPCLNWTIKLAAKGHYSQYASKTWLHIQLSNPQGKWFIGRVVHSVWLSYLAGGFIALLLVLMTRQYDFIWGSTILDQAAFQQLTAYLSFSMDVIHWPTPSVDEVIASQQGLNEMSSTLRSSWAYFLLGCLLFYGLFPRLVAWVMCRVLGAVQLRRFSLNYQDPYYLALKREWQPLSGQGDILDADSHAQPHQSLQKTKQSFRALPSEALFLGFELPRSLVTQLPSQLTTPVLVNVVNKDTTDQALAFIKNSAGSVVFLVNANKPPDRGTLRLLQSLMPKGKKYWLGCIEDGAMRIASENTYAQWQEQAQMLSIQPQHCVLLQSTDGAHD
jgi:hypothetical protein